MNVLGSEAAGGAKFLTYRQPESYVFITRLELDILIDQALNLYMAMVPGINHHVYHGLVKVNQNIFMMTRESKHSQIACLFQLFDFFTAKLETAIGTKNHDLVNAALDILWYSNPVTGTDYGWDSEAFLRSIMDFIEKDEPHHLNALDRAANVSGICRTFNKICKLDVRPMQVSRTC